MPPPAPAAFWAPKAGNSPEEYEDAYALDVPEGRFAVADGASETSFARRWARLLVDGFIAEAPEADAALLTAWTKPLAERWAQENDPKALPWYAQEKAKDGAFSSLLGLCLDSGAGRWRSLAVGDSCLFLIRKQKTLACAFPIERSAEFNNRPRLIASVSRANESVWGAARAQEGDLAPGDQFFLMTDALAQWFLVETEMKRHPWAALKRLKAQEDFSAFVDLLRAGRSLRNDDVTLVRVEA